MFNFDPERYLRMQQGAVAGAHEASMIVGKVLSQGIDRIVFLGAGGAGLLMMPAVKLLQTTTTFPTYLEYPAEIIHTGSVNVGPKTLVVIPSRSGTTVESIAALNWAKEQGATTMTLVGNRNTPLGQNADYAVENFVEDDTSCESFYIQALGIVFAIQSAAGVSTSLQDSLTGLSGLPAALLSAKEQIEPLARNIANYIASKDYHIITGSGSMWPEAFYYSMCILEEMQWIRTRPIHASDFFHGTLELVEPGVSMILFKGEDETRLLMDRVESFARKYTNNIEVLDTRDIKLEGVNVLLRGQTSHAVMSAMLERVSAHLEDVREHPLTTRRYYNRVSY